MTRKVRYGLLALLALFVLGIWFFLAYRDVMFTIPKLRQPLLDTMSADANQNAAFRNEAIAPGGALCGEMSGIEGGARLSSRPGQGRNPIATLTAATWRRFIVVPGVPAFFIEGLDPWAIALDGRKIRVDPYEVDDEREELRVQYALGEAAGGMAPAAQKREIDVKTRDEHFEVAWSQHCFGLRNGI